MRNILTARPRGAPGLAAAALLAVILASVPARAQDDPTGSWSAEEPGAFFLGGGSATDGTYLYLAGGMPNQPGGFNFPDDFRMMRRYDPATNTWAALDLMPFAVSETAAAFHGGRVYTFGATGILNALDAGTGAVVWSRNVAADTGRDVPEWGFASSPLVVDDAVIVAAAGTLAGYDRATGNRRWVGPSYGGSYSSPHRATIDGVVNSREQRRRCGSVDQTLTARQSGGIILSGSHERA